MASRQGEQKSFGILEVGTRAGDGKFNVYRGECEHVTNPRVHEIASYLGVASSEILRRLRLMEEFVSTSSSTVAMPIAIRVIESFGRSGDEFAVTMGLAPSRKNEKSAPHAAGSILTRHQSGLAPAEILRADPNAPSSRQLGWHAGPVARPRHRDLDREIARVERRYSVLRDQRSALAALGSQVVHMSAASDPVISGSDVALVRFSSAIETAFGLTREVMVLYTPYPDLQRRTFEAAFRQIKQLGTEATPDIIFIFSRDPRAEVKLDDWSSPGQLAIPFDFDDTDPIGLIKLLRVHLHTRDLFNETTPVSGTKFFGRKTLLQSLREDVLAQRVSGLFGLRKAGKTSVLFQLREDLKRDNVITVLIDLETFPAPPDDPVDDILGELRRRVIGLFAIEGVGQHCR